MTHHARHLPPFAPAMAIGLAIALIAACGGPAAPTAPLPASTGGSVAVALPEPAAPTASGSAAPAPSASPDPAPSSRRAGPAASDAPAAALPAEAVTLLDPPPGPGRFAIDLFRRGDFVSQATVEWCVPAAIRTIANVIDDRKPTVPGQRTLNRISRSLSSERLVGPGSEPEGWAGTLNRLGYGPYTVVAKRTRTQAVHAAARALRLTGKPVGILVWRGAHAWVMTGFEATADPAWTDDFRVTRVRVSDPWYPRTNASWGRTRGPDARISVTALARVYLPWRRPLARYRELDGRFVLVLPVAATGR